MMEADKDIDAQQGGITGFEFDAEDVAVTEVNSVICDDGGAQVRLLEEAAPQGRWQPTMGMELVMEEAIMSIEEEVAGEGMWQHQI
jgi:hypothetical protein